MKTVAVAALILLTGCSVLRGPDEPASLVAQGDPVYEGPCANNVGRFFCRAYELPGNVVPGSEELSPPRRLVAVHDPITDRLIAVLEVVDRVTGRQELLWLAPDLRARPKRPLGGAT